MPDQNTPVADSENRSAWDAIVVSIPKALLRFFEWWKNSDPYIGGEEAEKADLETRIEICFRRAFYDRLKLWIPVVVSLVLILYLLGNISNILIDLQATGLLVDIVGASILAVGLIRGVKGIKRDTPRLSTGALYGGSVRYSNVALSSNARDSVDGLVGVLILITGFVCQLVAVVF